MKRTVSRRAFLRWMALMTAASAGCAGQASSTATSAAVSTLVPTALATVTKPAPTSSPSPSATSLPPTATDVPTEVSSPTPVPSAGDRITSVIFLIQENHTFDSLFPGFPGADGEYAGKDCPDKLSADPPHQHADGLRSASNTTAEARCSYTSDSAATYWQLASDFALCDRYFAEVRGPSHPNYFMLTAAQSPIVNTPNPTDLCPDFCFDLPTLPDRLDAKSLSWRDYGGIMTDIKGLQGRPEITDRDDSGFFKDAAAGTLPNVAWINSVFLENGANLSGHPTGSLCAAQAYAARVINALLASPQWKSSALFLIWDDWGGFYDHVAPPVVEKWTDGTPFRYGYRVPCIPISPYTKRGYVSHETHSHVSLLHFAETVYGLDPLTDRDAQASDMLDCFDFTQTPAQHEPLPMPNYG